MEIVICAAVRASNGFIVRGHRHHDAIRTMSTIPGYEDERPSGDNQGFITSENRYVNREEAYKIQVAAGKMKDDNGGRLYSEDLY